MRTLLRTALAGLALALVLAVPALAENLGAAEVTAEALNFRTAPGLDSEILDAAPKGTVVLVLAAEGSWRHVRWDGREGYMSASYLTELGEAAMDLGGGTLTGDGVRFRDGPSTGSGVLRYLFRGDRVQVTGVSGPWYRVTLDGDTGYLYSDYVSLDASADSRDAGALIEEIIASAEAQKGVAYQWGGETPEEGFDCSGLMYYSFLGSGVSMNRTAATQYSQGKSVARDELLRGDLVFFASPTGWNISHVGLYLGDGQFLHASSGAGKVIVSSLSSRYYDTYYYGARRLLG